jgi:transposase
MREAVEAAMAKSGRKFGAADQAVVVKALLAGASVAAAAEAAGFCVQTLYKWRNRCATFLDAWEAAVEESGRPMLVASAKGRKWQLRRMRRNRFTPERKNAFLSHFAATCDAEASADAAEISISTVYDHRRDDPAFRAAWFEALEQGFFRLQAELVRQRLAAAAKLRAIADEAATPALQRMAADEFERAICLLREYRQSLAGPGKAGRPPTKWSFDAAFEALEKELNVFKLRTEQGDVPEKEDDEA